MNFTAATSVSPAETFTEEARKVMRVLSTIAVVGLVALTGLAALCGCGRAAPPAHTGITGRVFISGGPAPGITRPYPATRVKVIDAKGRVVAVATPGPDAAFRVGLSPGVYTVRAHTTAGNPWFQPQKVTVRTGSYSVADIYAQVP